MNYAKLHKQQCTHYQSMVCFSSFYIVLRSLEHLPLCSEKWQTWCTEYRRL